MCEVKYAKRVGIEVVSEVAEKVSRLAYPRHLSVRPVLICPLLKRSEMLPLKLRSAVFVDKIMIRCRRQRTQGLLRSRSRPMFV